MILPVKADVVSSNVSDFDHKGISISHFQGWPWELSIYCNGVVGSAQPLHWFCFNLYQSKEERGKSISPFFVIWWIFKIASHLGTIIMIISS